MRGPTLLALLAALLVAGAPIVDAGRKGPKTKAAGSARLAAARAEIKGEGQAGQPAMAAQGEAAMSEVGEEPAAATLERSSDESSETSSDESSEASALSDSVDEKEVESAESSGDPAADIPAVEVPSGDGGASASSPTAEENTDAAAATATVQAELDEAGTTEEKQTEEEQEVEHAIEATGVVPTAAGHTTVKGRVSQEKTDNFLSALWRSFVIMVFIEIGDRTFFIAAIMSAKHSRTVVWLGGSAALAFMTVVSTLLGVAAPLLFPRVVTHWVGVCLFLYFGITLTYKALRMPGKICGGDESEELGEVEEELQDKDPSEDLHPAFKALSAYISPVFLQAATLTFLAEWGDRSQIATIALAPNMNTLGLIVGASLGHSFATAGAVMGGRALASKLSEKAVATMGGVCFLVFAVLALLEDPESSFLDAIPSFMRKNDYAFEEGGASLVEQKLKLF